MHQFFQIENLDSGEIPWFIDRKEKKYFSFNLLMTLLFQNETKALREIGKSAKLIVLDDRSDADCLEKIKDVLKPLTCSYKIEQTKETGQGNSLHQQFKDSIDKNALVYFCEDDYLHEEDAIKTCWEFYE